SPRPIHSETSRRPIHLEINRRPIRSEISRRPIHLEINPHRIRSPTSHRLAARQAVKPRLLILQPSSLCNLDCTYCYVPNRQDKSVMSEATLRAALRLLLS